MSLSELSFKPERPSSDCFLLLLLGLPAEESQVNLKLVSIQRLVQLTPNCEEGPLPSFNLAWPMGGQAPVWSEGARDTHIWDPHGDSGGEGGSQQGEKK